MTPLERGVKIALGAGLTAPAIARLLRISVGEAKRIAVKMALERMKRSWPARGCSYADDRRLWHAGGSPDRQIEPVGTKVMSYVKLSQCQVGLI
jgi:hypothetical protein